jgi:SAM-dependent methyltransferase
MSTDAELRKLLEQFGDFSWMVPPRTMVEPAAWDKYWQDQLSHGAAGFVHMFVSDGPLVDVMRANGLRTVLCVGNGISQEPKALAWAGFDVTALDISPYAMEVARDAEPPQEVLVRLIGGRLAAADGQVRFVSGDLLDPSVCPGPYDLVIDRKTLQLYSVDHLPAAIRAVADRVACPGILFSQSHRNGPSDKWTFPVADWLRAEGWPLNHEVTTVTQRTGWLMSTSG